MKKISLAIFALALTISLFMPSIQTSHAETFNPTSYTINVSGTAEIKVVPDEVIITLGVESWNSSLSEAKSQNDSSVAKILALAKTYGIPPEAVQTDYINVQPTYNPDNHVQHEISGYFVRKTIVFTLKDTSKFEGLLTDALQAGANYVYGVDFRTTDLRKYKDQARALAIQAAKEKATALAGGVDRKIGKAISVVENGVSSYVPYYNFYNGFYGYNGYNNGYQQQSQNVLQNAGSGSATGQGDDTTFAPGEIVVNASVTVTFELTD